MTFVCTLGEKPNPIKGTKGIVKLNERVQSKGQWSIKLLNVHEKTITLEVQSSYIKKIRFYIGCSR